MPAVLDHLVIGAARLEEGVAWAESLFGVAPGGGGAHPLMGTHNALWKLGAAYIEVLAVDPAAEAPGRPRWYGIDLPRTAARIAERPRLMTWVVRPAGPIAAAVAGLTTPPGLVERHHRGDFHWHLTVSPEGEAPMAGMVPSLIEWPEGVAPPPERLPESGLVLERLEIEGADPALGAALVEMEADHLVTLLPGPEAGSAPPAIRAHLRRADGKAVLLD